MSILFNEMNYFNKIHDLLPRGHAATIEVDRNFICGYAVTWLRRKNFEIDTLNFFPFVE